MTDSSIPTISSVDELVLLDQNKTEYSIEEAIKVRAPTQADIQRLTHECFINAPSEEVAAQMLRVSGNNLLLFSSKASELPPNGECTLLLKCVQLYKKKQAGSSTYGQPVMRVKNFVICAPTKASSLDTESDPFAFETTNTSSVAVMSSDTATSEKAYSVKSSALSDSKCAQSTFSKESMSSVLNYSQSATSNSSALSQSKANPKKRTYRDFAADASSWPILNAPMSPALKYGRGDNNKVARKTSMNSCKNSKYGRGDNNTVAPEAAKQATAEKTKALSVFENDENDQKSDPSDVQMKDKTSASNHAASEISNSSPVVAGGLKFNDLDGTKHTAVAISAIDQKIHRMPIETLLDYQKRNTMLAKYGNNGVELIARVLSANTVGPHKSRPAFGIVLQDETGTAFLFDWKNSYGDQQALGDVFCDKFKKGDIKIGSIYRISPFYPNNGKFQADMANTWCGVDDSTWTAKLYRETKFVEVQDELYTKAIPHFPIYFNIELVSLSKIASETLDRKNELLKSGVDKKWNWTTGPYTTVLKVVDVEEGAESHKKRTLICTDGTQTSTKLTIWDNHISIYNLQLGDVFVLSHFAGIDADGSLNLGSNGARIIKIDQNCRNLVGSDESQEAAIKQILGNASILNKQSDQEELGCITIAELNELLSKHTRFACDLKTISIGFLSNPLDFVFMKRIQTETGEKRLYLQQWGEQFRTAYPDGKLYALEEIDVQYKVGITLADNSDSEHSMINAEVTGVSHPLFDGMNAVDAFLMFSENPDNWNRRKDAVCDSDWDLRLEVSTKATVAVKEANKSD